MTSVSDANPTETWEELKATSGAVLVDVRTKAEWSFVGIPDLSEIGKQPILSEWKAYPEMQVNQSFADEVLAALGGSAPSSVFFLCRSGVRSMEAAHLMSQVFQAQGQDVKCINVVEGFEGDLDSLGHRGKMNGWRARGLAWRQS